MKTLPRLLLIIAFLIASFVPMASSMPVVMAQDEVPKEPQSETPGSMPSTDVSATKYKVWGKVKTSTGQPVANVAVKDKNGNKVYTNIEGKYKIKLPKGENSLVVKKKGRLFAPRSREINVKGEMKVKKIQACGQYFGNTGFEDKPPYLWWNLPDYGDVFYPIFPATPVSAPFPVYKGLRSLRTGIPDTEPNDYVYSDGESQEVYIPSTSTSVSLSMWVYPESAETPALPAYEEPTEGNVHEQALAADWQYVIVYDVSSYPAKEYKMWWARENDAAWKNLTFDLTFLKGKKIKVLLGSFNDGVNGRTRMYFDKVKFYICPPIPLPPPPPSPPPFPPPPAGCTEQIANNTFEYNSTWVIPATAYSAGYSNLFALTGARSMRTGIYYWGHNRYSYSDFRQRVTIPSNATKAKLSYWAYPISGEPYNVSVPEEPTQPSPAGLNLSPESGDVQYLLVLNNWLQWISTPMWRRSNSQVWEKFVIDLMHYRGWTINLQFGTYNNGWGGVTSMFVDDVSLVTCK